jgi:cytochrome P450
VVNIVIDTSAATTNPGPADIPGYPMPRAGRCPFDPPPGLLKLQAEAPITRVRIWNGSTPWLISRHDDVRELLKDPRVSAATDHANYPFSAPSMFMQNLGFLTMDNPEHARQRRMVAKPFAIKSVEAMRPTIQKITDDVIDAMLAGPKPVDLVQALAFPVPARVICEVLGVPYADDDYLLNCVAAMVNTESTGEVSKAARQELVDYLERLIADKRADPADDLLSALATEHVASNALSEHEAALLGLLLVVAGHETTANMIALGTLALLEHPDQLEVLRTTEDPELIEGAVEELLRYLTVAQSGRRRVALEDIKIGGVLIRADEGLILASDLANRDQSVFPDPGRLDLRRPVSQHASFGAGPHQCLGQPLAKAELQVVYPALFRRIPTLRRAVDLDRIPFKQPGESVYGVCELPVTW